MRHRFCNSSMCSIKFWATC